MTKVTLKNLIQFTAIVAGVLGLAVLLTPPSKQIKEIEVQLLYSFSIGYTDTAWASEWSRQVAIASDGSRLVLEEAHGLGDYVRGDWKFRDRSHRVRDYSLLSKNPKITKFPSRRSLVTRGQGTTFNYTKPKYEMKPSKRKQR